MLSGGQRTLCHWARPPAMRGGSCFNFIVKFVVSRDSQLESSHHLLWLLLHPEAMTLRTLSSAGALGPKCFVNGSYGFLWMSPRNLKPVPNEFFPFCLIFSVSQCGCQLSVTLVNTCETSLLNKKVHLGSLSQRSQSLMDWSCCRGPVWREHIVVGIRGRAELLTPCWEAKLARRWLEPHNPVRLPIRSPPPSSTTWR